jgi:hypothetical protein
VEVVLRLENPTGSPAVLYLRGREPVIDVRVTRPDGSPVWHRLAGEIIPAIVRIETLEPRGALELRAAWDQRTSAGDPVPPGDYVITAEALTDGPPLGAPPRRIRIIP